MQLKLSGLFEELQQVDPIDSLAGIKKLKGYKTAYRIRIGDYRVGFLAEANTITLSRLMKRKEVYCYFP